MTHKSNYQSYSNSQLSFLVLLRVVIGWHFLYEGIAKLMNESWSSYGYLMDSKGFLSGLLIRCASDPGVVDVFNFLNIWGLILVGIGLIAGCLTKISLAGGISLLSIYFLSHPPLVGFNYTLPSEGSYLWVNKNLVELCAMAVLYLFPSQYVIGVDRLIFGNKKKD